MKQDPGARRGKGGREREVVIISIMGHSSSETLSDVFLIHEVLAFV